MTTHLNFEISVQPHHIENAEEDINRARFLLNELGNRCKKLSWEIQECEPNEKADIDDKTVSFLDEMSNILHFMVSTLENREDILQRVRSKATEAKSLKKAA